MAALRHVQSEEREGWGERKDATPIMCSLNLKGFQGIAGSTGKDGQLGSQVSAWLNLVSKKNHGGATFSCATSCNLE